MNKYSLKLLFLCAILLSPILIVKTVLAYGGVGGGGGEYGTPAEDWGVWCTEDAKARGECVHWVKGTIADFKDAWKNRRGDYTEDDYDICIDPSVNTDGYVIFAGYYGYMGDTLRLFNWTSDPVSRNNKLDHSQATTGRGRDRRDFFNDKSTNGLTYQQMMDTVIKEMGTDETNLAYFCSGMIEPPSITYDDTTDGDFSSISTATVKNGRTSDTKSADSTTSTKSDTASIYLQSKDNSNISTTFTIKHNIVSHVSRSSSPSWEVKRDGSSIEKSKTNLPANGTKQVSSYSETFDIPLGTQKKICQTISHTEKVTFTDHIVERDGVKTIESTTSDYSGWIDPSTTICVEAKHPYNFKITPEQPANTKPVVYAGESLKVSSTVTTAKNDDSLPPTITSPDTQIKLIQFTLSPSAPTSSDVNGGTSPSEPCTFFRSKLSGYFNNCGEISSKTEPLNPNASYSLEGNAIIPDTTIGTKYCTALGVYRSDSGDGYTLSNNWTITGANCYTISKKPNFQVWNSGIYTSGDISTSTSRKVINSGFGNYDSPDVTKTIFGSWDEQIAIANAKISGFGSGATLGYSDYGFTKPGGHNLTDQFQALSPLSISNSTDNVGYAQITSDNTLPDRIIARLESLTDNPHVTIIHSDGLIDRDYINSTSTSYNSISGLHQTIIIAEGNIDILEKVTQIDAWLIAKNGHINTCKEFGSGSTDGNRCNKPLQINGPIFAKELILNRTAGADPGDGSINPAEIFNLRPDAYLWAYSRSQDSTEAYTAYSRELAPRL